MSKQPLKCYVYVVRGFDPEAGKWAVLVDTNNNLDFSDETALYPESQDIKGQHFDYKNPVSITYEVVQKGRVVTTRVPMVVKTLMGDFVYNFPQHAKAVFKHGSKSHELLISSGFHQLDYEIVQLAKKPSRFSAQRIEGDELVAIDEFITIDGVSYKNKGVDVYRNVLKLERQNPNKIAYTLQNGQPFYPFATREFTTGKPVSLAAFRGKYVYIDFWATWCKGCVQDMPELRKLYRTLDKNRVAFLGVVSEDRPERVRTYLQKQAIDWPQILSDSTDKLTHVYAINALPATVLLAPDETIIARNLRAQELANTLRALGLQ